MFLCRHEASYEEPLSSAPVVGLAATDTRTAPGRDGGRDAAAQSVPEPRRRGPVRGRGASGPVVQAAAAAAATGHRKPIHGQRDGGRGGAVTNDHRAATVAAVDHVHAAGRTPTEHGD